MKSIGLMAAFAVLSAFSVRAEWTYDAGAKTITDGFWTLTVTAVSGTDITVTGLTGSAAEGGEEGRAIDLTEVKDGAGVSYRVVKFGGFSGQSSTKSTLWAKKELLTQFIAPHCSNISEQYAFNQCTSLKKVELNKEVSVSLAAVSFDGCISLESLEPRKIKSAGVYLFRNCEKLAGEFDVTDSVLIGQGAFSAASIERISGLDVSSVHKDAFNGCAKLKAVDFPKLKDIGERGFANCSLLEEVELPSVEKIGAFAFVNCRTLDKDDVNALLRPEIVQLGQNGVGQSFNGCTGIKGAIVWNMPNITEVPPSFFDGCSGISRVDFKTPVSKIGTSAFRGISPGAEIHLGRSKITSYGREAVGTKGTVPYPKVFVESFCEELLTAMETTNVTLREKDFQNNAWVSPVFGSVYTHSFMAKKMYLDETTCGKVKIDNVDYPSPKVKRVYAFVAWDACCWVIGEPHLGLTVEIR